MDGKTLTWIILTNLYTLLTVLGWAEYKKEKSKDKVDRRTPVYMAWLIVTTTLGLVLITKIVLWIILNWNPVL